MKCKVKNLDNKDVGDIDLMDEVFGVAVRADILGRMVNWQLAKRRAGTHKTKERGEVRGTTAKPFRQKGTGRARQGSVRSPLLRGGGVTFGPRPRSHAFGLPKKVRRLALKSALSAKQADGKLVVVDEVQLDSPKTKALVERIAGFGWASALIIGGAAIDENFVRAAANIPAVDVLPQQGINVYDILRRDTLVLTRDAVRHLEERLA
ncbi:MAG: 50S ribosomal protein L4 [Alphaproteobacteria bacterium]